MFLNQLRELVTARLRLRPAVAADLPAFLDLALDPRMTRLVGDGAPWSRARATARFEAGLATHRADRGVWLAVQDRACGQHVGVVAAHLDTNTGDVEVGIWVSPARWSTGVGREALTATLPVLTARYPGHRLIAEADAQHTASDRLLHSVNFRRHGQGIGRYGNRVNRYTWTPDHHSTWPPARRSLTGRVGRGRDVLRCGGRRRCAGRRCGSWV